MVNNLEHCTCFTDIYIEVIEAQTEYNQSPFINRCESMGIIMGLQKHRQRSVCIQQFIFHKIKPTSFFINDEIILNFTFLFIQ